MANDSTKYLKEGKQVEHKTADKYVKEPGLPHNKSHSKFYKPNDSAPKGR